jgi:hypothetical protein
MRTIVALIAGAIVLTYFFTISDNKSSTIETVVSANTFSDTQNQPKLLPPKPKPKLPKGPFLWELNWKHANAKARETICDLYRLYPIISYDLYIEYSGINAPKGTRQQHDDYFKTKCKWDDLYNKTQESIKN